LYFVTIPRSFLKMAEYLLGELEFEFYIDRADMPYPGLTWVIVLIMVIFLPIIFMNLLVNQFLKDKLIYRVCTGDNILDWSCCW
jgi:hypothetical protein